MTGRLLSPVGLIFDSIASPGPVQSPRIVRRGCPGRPDRTPRSLDARSPDSRQSYVSTSGALRDSVPLSSADLDLRRGSPMITSGLDGRGRPGPASPPARTRARARRSELRRERQALRRAGDGPAQGAGRPPAQPGRIGRPPPRSSPGSSRRRPPGARPGSSRCPMSSPPRPRAWPTSPPSGRPPLPGGPSFRRSARPPRRRCSRWPSEPLIDTPKHYALADECLRAVLDREPDHPEAAGCSVTSPTTAAGPPRSPPATSAARWSTTRPTAGSTPPGSPTWSGASCPRRPSRGRGKCAGSPPPRPTRCTASGRAPGGSRPSTS